MLTQETRRRLAIGASIKDTFDPLPWGSVVFSLCHYLQIAWVIVGSIAVNVVNNLIRGEWTPQHFFGNNTVFVKTLVSVLGNESVSIPRNVSTLPIGVIFAVQAFYFPFGEVGLLQLRQSRLAQSFVSKCLVFGGGHSVPRLKMGSANLHTTNKPAKFTSNCVFHKAIIPQGYKVYNLAV